ncbi:MAG: NUDIX hydrolase [Candidatus Harrisonbacteria bacterium]|nr:NUDIX hydrolase [Candidatus Harrisonbacteria bacterium]
MKLYTPPAVTVDTVIFTIEDGQLKVLLIKRADQPFKGSWALPGGFLLRNETSEQGALRILKEKAGVRNVYAEQLYTFDSLGRDPRGHVLTVAYFALVPRDKIGFEGSGDLQTPAFHPVKKLPAVAFDHKNIISYAVKRLQAKLGYTNVVFSLLPKYFTLNQLQSAYEIILDKKLDKRNFRKKFLSLGLMRSTRKMLSGTPQRPAKLYQFITTKPTELKKFF